MSWGGIILLGWPQGCAALGTPGSEGLTQGRAPLLCNLVPPSLGLEFESGALCWSGFPTVLCLLLQKLFYLGTKRRESLGSGAAFQPLRDPARKS